MLSKESGYILTVDQASNAAGVALWHNGGLVAVTTLKSRSPTDPFSRRIQHQLTQLTSFLGEHLPTNLDVEKVIFEGVKAKLVMITIGAFLVCPRISAKMHEHASFIWSSSWKKWALDHGAVGPLGDVKGIKSLKETGFDTSTLTTDDEADAIFLYLCWCTKT